jgi:hypothetical protein
MLNSNKLTKLRQRVVPLLVLITLSAGILFILPSCNKTVEKDDSITQATQMQNTETVVETQVTQETSLTEQSQIPPASSTLSLEGYGAKGALADKNLSVADMLTYAVQDEYLARGEYAAIIAKFGSGNPYDNIIRAEETHISYLKEIYTAYDMLFPEDKSAEHIVVPKDLLEAANTGVQAEIDNIAMYNIFLAYELPEDIREVFNSLAKGSESHLSAFQKQVDKLS